MHLFDFKPLYMAKYAKLHFEILVGNKAITSVVDYFGLLMDS